MTDAPLHPSIPGEPNLPLRPDESSVPASGEASAESVEAARFLVWDEVDEWGDQSFPASDPPANW